LLVINTIMLEAIVGPVLAVLVTLKLTDLNLKKQEKVIVDLQAKVEKLEISDKEIPKKMMATLMPVAKAVSKINQQLGL
jgi:hypothetical protein